MKKQIRKLKRTLIRLLDNFLARVTLGLKIMLALVGVFFLIFFFIIQPYEENGLTNNEAEITQTMSREEFIQTLAPPAQEAQEEYGTRASLLIAQAALESNWGDSDLSRETNNYFGIKDANAGEEYATREYNSEWTTVNASFKRYDSLAASVADYANLIKNGTSWDQDFYQPVLEANDYTEAAEAVQAAGYATDPDYADKLIQIIEQYQLYELDE